MIIEQQVRLSLIRASNLNYKHNTAYKPITSGLFVICFSHISLSRRIKIANMLNRMVVELPKLLLPKRITSKHAEKTENFWCLTSKKSALLALKLNLVEFWNAIQLLKFKPFMESALQYRVVSSRLRLVQKLWWIIELWVFKYTTRCI